MDAENLDRKVKRITWKNCGETLSTNDQNGNGNGIGNSSRKLSNANGPCMMPLLSIPNGQEYNSRASITMSGTAMKGGLVPSVGAVDIGFSKCAYYFRVSLPGVKKDPGQFSCEIARDGKVHIRGETSTGGKTVSRHCRVFEMKFQQQSPPGPFTLSFSLPGPVDPTLFYPIFRSDGIFEAVVLKFE